MEQPTREDEAGPSKWRYEAIMHHCIEKNVYDFGCGSAHGSRILAEIANNVQAYDKVKEIFKQHKYVKFTDDPIDVDIVTVVEVIEHIKRDKLHDLMTMFTNIAQELVITTPNGDLYPYHPERIIERRGYHEWHYTKNELYVLMRKYYRFAIIDPIIWDPYLEKFTGYKAYASNKD